MFSLQADVVGKTKKKKNHTKSLATGTPALKSEGSRSSGVWVLRDTFESTPRGTLPDALPRHPEV